MTPDPQHLFSVNGDELIPSDLVRGPWDHGLQHGGAVSGALGWATKAALDSPAGRSDEDTADNRAGNDFLLCRLTTEILRPVPAVPLRYRTSVDRAGRRSRVVSASLWLDDTCVARSSSQWARVRPADTQAEEDTDTDTRDAQAGLCDPAVPLRPVLATDPGAVDVGYPRPGYNCDVFELRCLIGSTEDPGPGTIWARMKVGLVAGVPTEPVHVVATVADLANAVGWEPSPNGAPMVNPDLTLQLLRYPVGEWVCLESAARATSSGIGMMDTTLWDGNGRFGRVLSTTMESPMPLAVDLVGSAD